MGEYLADDLLLRLQHRQFVFTIPSMLRAFRKHDRSLYADLGRLIYELISDYYSEAAGRKIITGMVSSHQTFGEFAVWNPHWHTIVLEGGFDEWDRFVFIPLGASEGLCRLWREGVILFFEDRKLLNNKLARSLRSWKHSGFSIESGARIYDDASRRDLAQYIIRGPVSLEKVAWNPDQDEVSWTAKETGQYKGELRSFESLEFIARITLHIPPKGKQLVRRYGVYSSRELGTWKERPALRGRAPGKWYGRESIQGDGLPADSDETLEVADLSRRKAWARLLKKVYEVEAMGCPRCGGDLRGEDILARR